MHEKKLLNDNIRFHLTISLTTLAAVFAFFGTSYDRLPAKWIIGICAVLLGVSVVSGVTALLYANHELLSKTDNIDRAEIRFSMITAIVSHTCAILTFVGYCFYFYVWL